MIDVFPYDEMSEHTEGSTCDCIPTVLVENGVEITVHNSFEEAEEAVDWAKEILDID